MPMGRDGRQYVAHNSTSSESQLRNPEMRHWWLRGGFWYYLFPILSLGILTAVPLYHAAFRLRSKATLAAALLFSAGGGAVIAIDQIYHPLDPDYSGSWAIFARSSLTLALLGYGLAYIGTCRRKVYLSAFLANEEKPTEQSKMPGSTLAPNWSKAERSEPGPARGASRVQLGGEQPGPKDELEVEDRLRAVNPAERYFLVIRNIAGGICFLAIGSSLLVGTPIGAILSTLSGEGNYFVRLEAPYAISYLGVALVATLALLIWLTIGYDPEARTVVHALFLGAAAIVNIYLGFAIWVTVTYLLSAEMVSFTSRDFGLMVWWNLIDSIPVADVDSALDWEQPIDEYSASIGWLLLIQRLILLLTLARAIQALIEKWHTPKAQKAVKGASSRFED